MIHNSCRLIYSILRLYRSLQHIGTVGIQYVKYELCAAPSRFSPELLGVQASSALVWLIMEVLAVLLSLYLVAINTDLTTIDLLAFSGYKYVGYVISLCFIPLSTLYFMFYFETHLLIFL